MCLIWVNINQENNFFTNIHVWFLHASLFLMNYKSTYNYILEPKIQYLPLYKQFHVKYMKLKWITQTEFYTDSKQQTDNCFWNFFVEVALDLLFLILLWFIFLQFSKKLHIKSFVGSNRKFSINLSNF